MGGEYGPSISNDEFGRLVKFSCFVVGIVVGVYGFDSWLEAKIESKVDPLESQIESLDRSKNAQYGIIRGDIQTLCEAIDECEIDR